MKSTCVVIGSGLAGTLIANALAEPFDVTVLEIGPKNSTKYPDVHFVQKKLAEVDTFCHGAGGTTNRWHNGLIPMRTSDVSDPTFRQLLNEARPFMDAAGSALHFPGSDFSNQFEKILPEVASIGEHIGSFSDGVDCLIYPKHFAPLRVKPSVRAFYDVDSLEFVVAGSRITSIGFSSGSGKQSIPADVVIVSAGALGTPKILTSMLSAFGELHDGYDSHFVDHPMGFVGKFKFPRRLVDAVSKFALLDKGEYVSNNIVRLKSECGQYTGGAYFRPALTMDNRLDLYKYKSRLGGTRGRQRIRTALSPRMFHPDIVAEIVSHLFSIQVPTRIYSVLFLGEQRTRANRVFYDNERLNVDWTIRPEEITIYRQMIERFVDMFAGAAEESVVQADLTPDWLWSAAHHSGTTRLGDPPNGVIDSDLRLKCSENVFVCDGSVIQEHSYTNTGLTIGQLALRLAQNLTHQSLGVDNRGSRARDSYIGTMNSPTHATGDQVLVTGASGFLGRRIVERLSSQGYRVRAFVRESSRTEHLVACSADIAVGDVADISSLESAFEGVQYVVHAAADTTGSEEGGRSVTVGGTRNVLSLCNRFEIKKLVYISSCSVYQVAGLEAHEVIEESSALESSPAQRGPYSWAKLEAENLVTAFLSEGTRPVVCLRPGAVYGPEGDPFPPLIGYSLKNKLFVVIGRGGLTLPLVHVDHVAEAVLRAMEHPNADGKVFNVVDPDRVTKKRYNNLLVRRLYPGARFMYIPYSLISAGVSFQELLFKLLRRRPFLTRYRLASSQGAVIFDGAKIRRELEWEPSNTFERAVEGFQALQQRVS